MIQAINMKHKRIKDKIEGILKKNKVRSADPTRLKKDIFELIRKECLICVLKYLVFDADRTRNRVKKGGDI